MKKIKLYISLILISFISINISFAFTQYIEYKDIGCINPFSPYPPRVTCTTKSTVYIGGGCPPGTSGEVCSPRTNWIDGQENTLTLSHYITFDTEKKEYMEGETIIPLFSSTNLSVVCPTKYNKTIPANMIVSNLEAYIGSGIDKDVRFTSSNWTSFILNKAGDYTLGAKNMNRNPLVYTNDCNDSQDIEVKYGAYGLNIFTSTFTVLSIDKPSIKIK